MSNNETDPVKNDNSDNVAVVQPPAPTYAKPFPDISKIEVFGGQNFRRWQERITTLLDVHGVAHALTDTNTPSADPKQTEDWTYANKVCRHTILSTLSNDLFDVYCGYKVAKEIWDNMTVKYTAEDAGKQKFVIGNYYNWTMTEDKDIKVQINEYHKLLEDLKAEKITLPDEFVAGLLIEKLPESWKDYKQQLKHKHRQLSLSDLITHIIIEDRNRKDSKAAKAKALAARANMVQNKPKKRYDNKKPDHNNNRNDYVPRVANPNFKRRGTCFVCGKPGHHAPQCRHRAKNDNPPRPKANLVEADGDDIIAAVVSQVNIVTDVKKWVVDSGATRHICANKDAFTSYTPVGDGEELVYMGDSRTAAVSGKGQVLLKLTSGVDFKVKYVTVGGKKLKLAIWDTAGQERFRTLTSSYYRGAQGIIMVYDVTRRETFTNLSDIWAKEIDLYSTNQDCIKMLVGNKVDKESERVVSKREGIDFAREYGCLYTECSAKTRVNVEQCFEELVMKILDTPSLLAEGSSGVKKNIFKQNPPQSDALSSGCCSW